MAKYILKKYRDIAVIPTLDEWIKRFEEKHPEVVKENKRKKEEDKEDEDDT